MFDKSPGALLDYHRSMLADERRTRALEQAIQATVKPGDIVLDLGCGSGVLSCFACRAGARRVYAVEQESVIELARAVCRDNGYGDRVVFIHRRSTAVQLPEPVDVLITETIGNLAFEEGILGWVADARQRWLKPGGILIPRSLELCAAPLELPVAYRDISLWDDLDTGLDFSAARRLAAHNPLWIEVPPEAALAPPSSLGKVDLRQNSSDCFHGSALTTASRAGICHGIGGWFRAELTEAISLSNAPPLGTPSWRQGFLPLASPLCVAAGDVLSLRVSAHGNGALWRWGIGLGDAPPVLQSTLTGQFLSMPLLRKGSPNYAPARSPAAEVDYFILHKMDGNLAIAEIARQLCEQFPDRFGGRDEALARVEKLSRRYSP